MKIYIAGPDVFERNSIDIGKRYSSLCQEYGFKALYPLDNVVDFTQDKQKISLDIYKANIELIKQSDIVIANLNNFRGKEADSGTIWECGYAYALGKTVYGYMHTDLTYVEQFTDNEKMLIDGKFVDKNGKFIEDFNLSINLMIAHSCTKIISGSFEDVLKFCKH
ncbi:MAG: nucleoside 2-deoxyribosyltransferase [Sulfurimonas sp.]|nr:MAG: nucleoside 2-deoxyribosyltransferase [Sulfurimonas sp.]